VIDHAFHLLGPHNLEDLLDVSGDHIDYIKLAVATAPFQPREVLLSRLAVMHTHEVEAFIRSNLFELTIQRCEVRGFLDELVQLGISTLELSSQVIPLCPRQQAQLVDRRCSGGSPYLRRSGARNRMPPSFPRSRSSRCAGFGCGCFLKLILESYKVEKALAGERVAADEARSL